MYKLVIIGGKKRGEEFTLKSGENTIGRDHSHDICLDVDGVSRDHVSLTVNIDDTVYLQDKGSANGTFVNGKILKNGTINPGDKITLPNLIMQLIWVKEKKVIVKKRTLKAKDDELDVDIEPMPVHLPGKIKYFFRHKIMPPIYGFNEEYEWSVMFGILLAVFISINIAFTILPVLKDSKRILVLETAKRGTHYAEEIARLNAVALEAKDIDRLETTFLESEEGVDSYELYDPSGRIVRPIDKLNHYTQNTFSIAARDWAVSESKSNTFIKVLDQGKIGIARRIMAYNPKLGYQELVGIIAIHFAPTSLAIEASRNSKAYLEALSMSAIIALLFFAIIYYLTVQQIDYLRREVDEILKGKKKEFDSKYLMKELDPLRSSLNTILQKVRELDSSIDDGIGGFEEMEADDTYVDKMEQFLDALDAPALVMNSEKMIKRINTTAEDLIGLRETASMNQGLFDVASNQGFAATVNDLCDRSANEGGQLETDTYELTGMEYNINVVALMGRDNFAKAFLVTFVKDI